MSSNAIPQNIPASVADETMYKQYIASNRNYKTLYKKFPHKSEASIRGAVGRYRRAIRQHIGMDKSGRDEVPNIRLTGSGNVLVIGDTHEPFCHVDYLDHCQRVRDRFKCDTVIHIGDLVDLHAVSYHESDPDGYSAGDEVKRAQEKLYSWYDAFPEVYGLWGNHDKLITRKAFSNKIPKHFIKSFEDSWDMPEGWSWHMTVELNNVFYHHGDAGGGGMYPAINHAKQGGINTVAGHYHGVAGAWHWFARNMRLWGMSVGCGVDKNSYAMAYAKSVKGIALGCGVVLDSGYAPLFMPMDVS